MPLLTALIAQNGHILVLIYFIFQKKKKKKNENLKIWTCTDKILISGGRITLHKNSMRFEKLSDIS